MRTLVTLWSVVAALAIVACATTQPAPSSAPIKHSGFLDDYSILRPGAEGEARLLYRNPDARWGEYDKVIFEPVAVWRSGKSSLDEISDEDLDQLAHDLHHAIQLKLESDYEIVDEPGPDVMRIRLALTDAEASDRVLDIFTTVVPPTRVVSEIRNLATGTQAFIGTASIEGQITDADTDELLLAAMDTRMGRRSLKGSGDSWADVHDAFAYWAERISRRLGEARRGEW